MVKVILMLDNGLSIYIVYFICVSDLLLVLPQKSTKKGINAKAL